MAKYKPVQNLGIVDGPLLTGHHRSRNPTAMSNNRKLENIIKTKKNKQVEQNIYAILSLFNCVINVFTASRIWNRCT